jgi:hypothetical protein
MYKIHTRRLQISYCSLIHISPAIIALPSSGQFGTQINSQGHTIAQDTRSHKTLQSFYKAPSQKDCATKTQTCFDSLY